MENGRLSRFSSQTFNKKKNVEIVVITIIIRFLWTNLKLIESLKKLPPLKIL